MASIEVQNLQKSYGELRALRGVSFRIEKGEVVGFLGPNGAGKSTAMKCITGFIAPSAGSVAVDGKDVLTDRIEAQRRIGYLPENAPIYADMRVRDYLDYVARIRGLGPGERAQAIARVAHECGIEERLGQQVGELSKGYRQRVGLAQALVHSPPILILDEPTTGLDPNQIVEIRNLVRAIGRTRTVVLSTHILSEVQATCDRVLIIHQGELVADGATDEVTTRTRGGLLVRVEFAAGKIDPRRDELLAALLAVPGVESARALQGEEATAFAYEVLASRDCRADLFELAVREGIVLTELHRAESNLEEVFRRLTVGQA